MNIKPLADRLLVKIEKEEKKSEGGIFLPGSASSSDTVFGKVVSVGEGRKNEDGNVIPMSVSADSVVLLHKHAGTPVKIDGEEYVIVRESELLAVVE